MVRVVLWEFRKIIEHKLVWMLVLLCLILAFVFEGTSSYRYEYGKQFEEKDLYQYSVELEKKYPGALNQYSDAINEHYNELNNQYQTLASECNGDLKDCHSEAYFEFMNSKKIYELVIYKDLKNAIKEANRINAESYTQFNQVREILTVHMNEDSRLKSEFISLKLDRLDELEKVEAVVYINHESVLSQYIDGVVFYSFLILIILGVGLIPVFAYDYDYRTNYLIGSCKTGRQLVFGKIIASLLYGLVIVILFFTIHTVRFLIDNQALHVLRNPLYDSNNNSIIPWRDVTFIEFIVYYWGYILILVILSILIMLLVSRLTKRFLFGVIVTSIYFSYPFIIDELRLNISFKFRYILNNLSISSIFAHSEQLLLLGDPYKISVYDHRFWGRDVIMLNASLLTLLLGFTMYRFIKKIDLT